MKKKIIKVGSKVYMVDKFVSFMVSGCYIVGMSEVGNKIRIAYNGEIWKLEEVFESVVDFLMSDDAIFEIGA